MQELSEETIGDVLGSLQYATEAAKGWAKAWHNWALFNVQVGFTFWISLIVQGSRPMLTCLQCDCRCLLTVSLIVWRPVPILMCMQGGHCCLLTISLIV